MDRQGYRELIGHKGFRSLLSAQFFGAINDNLFKMVVSLLALSAGMQADSGGGYLSLTAAVFVVPYLLFSGYAGYAADVLGKRRVLVAAKFLEVAIMGAGAGALVLGRIDLLLATLFLMGAQTVFFGPAKYGILPEMLPVSRISRANGLIELGRYLGIVLGTVAGALLLPAFRDEPAVIGAIIVAVAAVGALFSLGIDATPRDITRKPPGKNPWAEIASGARRLAGDSKLGPVVAGITFFEFLASLVLLNAILLGKEQLMLDEAGIGVLLIGAGVGIGLGCFAAGRLSGERIEIGLVPLGILGVALSLIAASGTANSPGAAVAAMVTVGLFGGLIIVPLNARLQHLAGGAEKGRLIATNNFINMAGVLLSCLILWLLHDVAGVAADRIMLLAGIAALILAVAVLWHCTEYRLAMLAWLGRAAHG